MHEEMKSATGRIDSRSINRVLTKYNLKEQILQQYPKFELTEAYYWHYHKLAEYPNKCKVCKTPLAKLVNFSIGYGQFNTCSTSCAALDPDRIEKTKKTVLNRYGVEHHTQSDLVKNKIKDTCESKYGVSNPLQLQGAKDGLFKKFGVHHISQSIDWKQKTKETFTTKYSGRGFAGELGNKGRETLANELGVHSTDFTYQTLAALAASKRGLLQSAPRYDFELLEYNAACKTLKLKHSCGAIKDCLISDTHRLRCLVCSPLSLSSFEVQVIDFLKSQNVKFTVNDRKIISPLELDIVIENLKIAIECNGDYWHSYDTYETKEERFKHLKKLEQANSAGYSLIQIAEHEWKEKKEIIKSILSVKLGLANKIFARKLEIKNISSKEANEFCQINHIQGKAPHKIAVGAFYQGGLVACVTAGKNRFTKRGLELIRFATKLNTVLVGGFSKLIKALRERTEYVPIESYLDRRIFDGHSLLRTGWVLDRTSAPGYCWLFQGQKITRSRTQKHRLKKILGAEFSDDLSEAANMFKAGASRLWDCGQHVFTLE